jgi:glycosyltransferase involved in cell wall biosynthesis
LVTDAWEPQVNGVVRTYQRIVQELRASGWRVTVVHPGEFNCVPIPSDPHIPVAWDVWKLPGRLKRLRADHIHLATEGPLGMTARTWCGMVNRRFTSSFHTKFPEFIVERIGIPLFLTYGLARWFHNRSSATLVPTPSLLQYLKRRRFRRCVQWTHGVDTEMYHPSKRRELPYARPVILFVGRISVEKNIDAFLTLALPGTKVLVGDGPLRASLEEQYPEAVFVGEKFGEELACLYASADVLVFPSRTDTFGLVLLEALASGTPVAGFPVTGPLDLIEEAQRLHYQPHVCAISEDLAEATARALKFSRTDCRRFAEHFSWDETVRIFIETLVPVKRRRRWGEIPPRP